MLLLPIPCFEQDSYDWTIFHQRSVIFEIQKLKAINTINPLSQIFLDLSLNLSQAISLAISLAISSSQSFIFLLS